MDLSIYRAENFSPTGAITLLVGLVGTAAAFALAYERVPRKEPVSLDMTRKELYELCKQYKIETATWRAYATKARMVRALHAAGIEYV